MTAEDYERQRLATLSVESEYKNVVQVELLYRSKWVRFEINALEVQHLSPTVLWARHLVGALKAIDAPDPVVPDPVLPDTSRGVADIGVVDSLLI